MDLLRYEMLICERKNNGGSTHRSSDRSGLLLLLH
jgi:hypothetical protein